MINKPLFVKTLLIFTAVTALSFFAFQSPALNAASFIFILAAVAALAFRSLLYGVMALFGELLISSQGHLFDLYPGNFRFSLRMGLFAVLLAVWGLPRVKKFLQKPRDFILSFKAQKNEIASNYYIYCIFAFIILFGIVNGILNHNNSGYIFQDANGYFFFALVPVFLSAVREYEKKSHIDTALQKSTGGAKMLVQSKQLVQVSNLNQPFSDMEKRQFPAHTLILTIWAAGIVFQAIEQGALLFLYGHLDVFWRMMVPLYQWFRDQRIIEVGVYKYNFYRVFLQSNLFAVTGLITFSSLWLFQKTKKFFRPYSLILVSAIFALIISLSRSFWIASIAGIIFVVGVYIALARPSLHLLGERIIQALTIAVASVFIIALLLLAPIGKFFGLSALASIPNRATETNETAISSRWSLLPELLHSIQKHPILGNGFGATATYKTSDPRYLAAHPNNPYYTTFAFEWGWLDVWYKFGLLGLIAYIALIGSLMMRGVRHIKKRAMNTQNKNKPGLYTGLLIGVAALAIVHFFTPFLNHPLGIGYLLIAEALFFGTVKSEH